MKKTGKRNKSTIEKAVYACIVIASDGFEVCIADKNNKHIKSILNEFVTADKKELDKKIFGWLYKYQVKAGVKIIAISIVTEEDDGWQKLSSDLWLKQDIVPYVVCIPKGTFKQKARRVVVEMMRKFNDNHIVDIQFDPYRRVYVDRLARIEDIKKHTSKEHWKLLLHLIKNYQEKDGRILFFSSTPRGGGVALMRHALIRLYRQFDVDAHWYVLSSKKAAFNITKKKFHNILHGVADEKTILTQKDIKVYNNWIAKNAERFSKVIKEASVIVIDDPQPSGLIPYIKKYNPGTKIIYRSHIQIRSDLIKKKGSPQEKTWKFLWNNIRHADLFVSHPIKKFVPHNVPKKKIVYMPATTDKLDGINKTLTKRQKNYYFALFDKYLTENDQTPLDHTRPYIIQIARFDPSKGIPDVIEAYGKLRDRLKLEHKKIKETPQLVIVGHGAIDDPDGLPVYRETLKLLAEDRYKNIASDIKAICFSDNDQILNALLSESLLALQLSYREGFEVKVSEALYKGKPVIAYKTGGIPLQIQNNITGILVPRGNISQVAEHMHTLLTNKKLYAAMSKNAKEMTKQEVFTVANAINWLFLATELLQNGGLQGNMQTLKAMLEKRYKM